MKAPGVARIERLDAKDGRGSRGWGWHRDADPTAAAPGWRDQRWVEWARVAGAQRAAGGAIVVSQAPEGAFVASLEPERTVVVGPLDASLAEAISLRGQPIWKDGGIDLHRVEDAVAGVPAAVASMVPQIEALLSVLWDAPAHPNVLVVDLQAGSPWVEAFRVVAELVGLTSVAVGAGRVLDDRPVGAEIQLVDPEVAARWSQSSGSYPLLRSDAALPRSAEAVAMTTALVHAGSASALRNAARRSGAADGRWSGLKAWFADRVSRFGAVPMLAGDQLPQDSLQDIAATPAGRAWLIEDALGPGAAWAVRADPARSFESLGAKNPQAFGALRDATLHVWSMLNTTADRMALVQRLGQHLASADQLARFIQQTFDSASEAERADVARWAGQLGLGLDAASPQVQALLGVSDPADLPELIRSLANPLALAEVVTAGARWARAWFDLVDGAFGAATLTVQGVAAVIDLAVADPTFAANARVGTLTPAGAKQVTEAVKRREVTSAEALAALVTGIVRPLLGEEGAVTYLQWAASQRRLPLLAVVEAADASEVDWAPADDLILVALNQGPDDVDGLLDLQPAVEPLLRYVQTGTKTRWEAAWLRRRETIEALLRSPSGIDTLIDLAAKDPTFLEGPRGEICRSAFATYRPTAGVWVERVRHRLEARPLKEASAVVERACIPVLPDVELNTVISSWLGRFQGKATDAELLALVAWLNQNAPRVDALPELIALARGEPRRSAKVASVLVDAGATLADLLPPGADTTVLQWWIDGVGEPDRAFAEELARHLDRHPLALQQIQLSASARAAAVHHRLLSQVLARNANDPRDGLEMMLGSDDADRFVDRLLQPVVDERKQDVAKRDQAIAALQQEAAQLRQKTTQLQQEVEQAATSTQILQHDLHLERADRTATAQELQAKDEELTRQSALLAERDETIADHGRVLAEAVRAAVAPAPAPAPRPAVSRIADDRSGGAGPRLAEEGGAGPIAAKPRRVLEADHLDPPDAESQHDGRSGPEAEGDAAPVADGKVATPRKGRALPIVFRSLVGAGALVAFLVAGILGSWADALDGAGMLIGLVAGTASIGRLLNAPHSFRRGVPGDRAPSASPRLLIFSMASAGLAVVAVGWADLAWWATLILAILALLFAAVVALGVERVPAVEPGMTPQVPKGGDSKPIATDGDAGSTSGVDPASGASAVAADPPAAAANRKVATPERPNPKRPKPERGRYHVVRRLFAGRTPLVDAKALTVFVVAALAIAGITDGRSTSTPTPKTAALPTTTAPTGGEGPDEGNGETSTTEVTETTAPRGEGQDLDETVPGRPTAATVDLLSVPTWQVPVQEIERKVQTAIGQTGADPATAGVRVVVVYGAEATVDKGRELAQAVVNSLATSEYFANAAFESSAGGGTPGSVRLVVYFDP